MMRGTASAESRDKCLNVVPAGPSRSISAAIIAASAEPEGTLRAGASASAPRLGHGPHPAQSEASASNPASQVGSATEAWHPLGAHGLRIGLYQRLRAILHLAMTFIGS